MVYILNPSTQESEAGRSLGVEVSLVLTASSRTSRATQKDPVLSRNKQKTGRKQKSTHRGIPRSSVQKECFLWKRMGTWGRC